MQTTTVMGWDYFGVKMKKEHSSVKLKKLKEIRRKNLERKLHKMFKEKRVLKYEVFRNLNKDDIKVIMKELGNKINVAI